MSQEQTLSNDNTGESNDETSNERINIKVVAQVFIYINIHFFLYSSLTFIS